MKFDWPRALAPVALVVSSIAFRWPALIHANTVNSDAAIVGLQAMHILRGEFQWLLFGSGYQTSVDSIVAAGFFVVLGPTPLALMLSTLTGHIVLTLLAYGTLARHLPRWTATLVTLPLVFTPSPLHTYILGPPRQASLTLVFAAVWLLDGAKGRAWDTRARFAGGVIASLACFADPYGLLFFPPLLLFAFLRAREGRVREDGTQGSWTRTLAATLTGAALGMIPLVLLLSSAKSVHGEATFTPRVLAHNASLLVRPCLPWILGITAYIPSGDAGYLPWQAGAFGAVQLLGPLLVLGTIAFGVFGAHASPVVRRVLPLGILGIVVELLTVAAFLVSPMVMDLFSARYLASMVLMLPFALAPAALRIPARTLLWLLGPFLLSTGVSGWLGFGAEARGVIGERLAGGGAIDEQRLEALLAERGVAHAVADYWVSYRLTFLTQERIEVVPIHASEDRYAPYRRAFEDAPRVAYVFDPQRSRENLGAMQRELAEKATYGRPIETLKAGELTAVIVDRLDRGWVAPSVSQ